jgi:hypothetical protein
MPAELGTGIVEFCAQIKQGLCLLVFRAPSAGGKGLSLARNPFDMSLAISDHTHMDSLPAG